MEQTKSFLSRRKLLAGVAGTTAASAALMALPLRTVISNTFRELLGKPPAPRRMLPSLANAEMEGWQDQIGTTFAVGGGTSLKLIGVSPMRSTGQRPSRVTRSKAFLAMFDVQNRGTMAGDLIYTAVHPRFGAFSIFLSASTDPRLPHRMTALFN